jgi:ABC-2 type transport system permease protein
MNNQEIVNQKTVNRSELNLVAGSWARGFNSIYRKELASFFKTRSWTIQLLIWLTLTVIIPAWITLSINFGLLSSDGNRGRGIILSFFGPCSIMILVGVILLAQGLIMEEKLGKTLLWIFSKPLSATGFILGKFAACAVFIAAIVIGGPGLIAFITAKSIGLAAETSTWNYLAGLMMLYLMALFFLALTIMLGVLLNNTRGVIGTALLIFFAGLFMPLGTQFSKIEPYTVWAIPGDASALFAGRPPSSIWISLTSTVVCTGLFLAVATWRMKRHEL